MPELKNEPIKGQIDAETLTRIVQEATAKITAEEVRKPDRAALVPNPDAEGPKPAVTGERVPHWSIRGFRSIQSVAAMELPDTGKRSQAAATYQECGRQYFAMSKSQREDEEKEARAIVQDALDDGRITAKAARRIYNFLDDPEEREFLSQTRTHSTLTGPSGEFLVPKPMLASIYTIIEEYGLAQRLCTNVTLTSKDLDLNSIATAATANWAGEAASFTESDLVLGQNVLETAKLGAVSSITSEQDEDQLVPLIPSWLDKVGEDIALKIDQSVLIGDGTSTYGGFVGITNMSGVQTFTAGASDLAPANLVEADFDSVVRLLSVARRMRAQWVMPRIVWDYIRKFESTVGARIVQGMLTRMPEQFYDGFPVNLSEAMDNTDGDVANRDFAILGDFSRTLLGFRRGITVETSREAVISNASGVVTFNAFQQDGMLVKISLRVGHQTPTGHQSAYAILNAPAS